MIELNPLLQVGHDSEIGRTVPVASDSPATRYPDPSRLVSDVAPGTRMAGLGTGPPMATLRVWMRCIRPTSQMPPTIRTAPSQNSIVSPVFQPAITADIATLFSVPC